MSYVDMTVQYKKIYKPEHPNAYKTGRVLEHRYVMSEHLGRPLDPEEHVHHIDHDWFNNALDNLELVSRSEHLKLHGHVPPKAAVKASLSAESCAKRSATYKKIQHQKGSRNSQFGTKWITNGTKNAKINKEDNIPEGWRSGRVMSSK